MLIIVTIPTIMVAVLSAVGAFTSSEAQTFNTLKAITRLKESQITSLISRFENDAQRIQEDSEFYDNVLNVLKYKQNEPGLVESYKRFTRSRMAQIISAEDEVYKEVMVLNTDGVVMVSTIAGTEGQIFQNQLFFRQGLSDSMQALQIPLDLAMKTSSLQLRSLILTERSFEASWC